MEVLRTDAGVPATQAGARGRTMKMCFVFPAEFRRYLDVTAALLGVSKTRAIFLVIKDYYENHKTEL